MGDARLVPAALGAWAAALLSLAGHAAWAVAAAVSVGPPIAVAWARGRRPGAAVAAVLVAVAVLAAAGTASTARAGAVPWERLERVEIRGVAVDASSTARGDVVILAISAWRVSDEEGWHRAHGRVRVAVDAAPAWGDTVGAEGRVIVGRAGPLVVDAAVRTAPPTGLRAVAARARIGLERATAGLADAPRALVRGMSVGDEAGMPEDLAVALRVSGLAHLTAVSGAHFAIVIGAVLVAVRGARGGRLLAAAATVAVSGAFAAVVSGGGSVTRALGMAAVTAIALGLGRRGSALPALAGVVLALLVLDPFLARDLGFALSVAAVAGIAVLAPAGARRLAALPRWLAHAVATTLAAQAACLPLLVGWGAELGPWSIVANAVAAPFAVPATLAGVGALAVGAWWPAAAQALAHVAAGAAWPIEVAARACASAPGAGLRWRAGLLGIALACAALACLATVVHAGTHRSRRVGAVAGCVLTATALVPHAWVPVALGGLPHGWTVLACDVGQGDAIVVRAGGAAVLIDTGRPDGAVAACLARAGLTRLDLVVLSHEHADHVGGLAQVGEAARVDRVWLPPGASPRLVEVARGTGARIASPEAGAAVTLGGVAIEVLSVGPAPRSREGTEVNDSSVVVGAVAGGLRLLALGDLELEGQSRLLATLRDTRSPWRGGTDVVKVAHHGAAAQDAGLADALAAPLGLVSVGEGNEYGHPADAALDVYARAGTALLRTDTCGDIAVLGGGAGEAPRAVSRCRPAVAG